MFSIGEKEKEPIKDESILSVVKSIDGCLF
jgi:hypothetical protein